MARGHTRSAPSRSRSRLPKARVEWLEGPDNDIEGTIDTASPAFAIELYDFGGAQKYADNYGGGDWTVERGILSLGVFKTTSQTNTILKVCIGIGMLNTATSITDVTAASALSPRTAPEASWMVRFCCFVNMTSLEVTRCEFDLGMKRRISPQSKLIFSLDASPTLGAGIAVFAGDLRLLLRQRGSRL